MSETGLNSGALRERMLMSVLEAGASGRRTLTSHACQQVLDTITAQRDRIAELQDAISGRTFSVDEGREWKARFEAAEARIEADARRIAELEAELASGSFYQEKDIDAMQARIAELEALLRRVPGALNSAFSAGMEEREGGSARRQAKDMEAVDALRRDARAALGEKTDG